MMQWLLANTVGALLLPPADLLLLLLAAYLIGRRNPQWGRRLTGTAALLLYLLSTPLLANFLLQQLQSAPALQSASASDADAIVILGGGVYYSAPEYGGDTVKAITLERLRYGVHLARLTHLPILVSGGCADSIKPEAQLMAEALESDFRMPVKWREGLSRNTADNARFSAHMLQQSGIHRIYLVTHAWHMARALPAFKATGLTVIPAPTSFSTNSPFSMLSLIPSATALLRSYYAAHEAVGLLWYWVTGVYN